MTPEARADLVSRGIVGTGIALGLAHLVLNGSVTGGGPINVAQKRSLESTGWQPYSLKIGNKYISYHRFEPLGLTLSLVADAIHGSTTGDPEHVAQAKADTAIASIARNTSDLPYMFSVSSLMDVLHDTSGKRAQNFVARQVGSFIPAGVANIAQGMDRTVRRPQGVIQSVESRIPGLTKNVPPVMDVSGQPVQRPASGLGGANPFPVTTQRNDPAVSEMARLGVTLENAPAKVTAPKTGLHLKRGQKAPSLTVQPDEARELQGQDAATLTSFLRVIVTTPVWKEMGDDEKRNAIKHVRTQIAGTRFSRLLALRGANPASSAAQPTP
jgi:hypothetical protein